MNAVDTNVLVYRVDNADPIKQSKAKSLLRLLRKSSIPTLLMWQVAGEFLQRLRWGESQKRITHRQMTRYFRLTRASFRLQLPTNAVLDRSLDLASRFSLSHWDSMIVAACIEAGVTKLFTEDMGSPTNFDSLELENPFA
jgi:predicted nucleic acid-binding protein